MHETIDPTPSLSELRGRPKQLIDDTLVERIHEVGSKLPGDTKIEDLMTWRDRPERLTRKRNGNMPPEWKALMEQLPNPQKAVLLSCVSQAYTAGHETLDEIRRVSYQELIESSSLNRLRPRQGNVYIGTVRAAILKRIF